MTKTITKNSKKGFTLVELVIVIAILAILAAIAIPVVNSIINTASRNTALSNADTIELAVKECQAHIASKNGEVYSQIAEGKYKEITIKDVAEAKAITEAFEVVTYNGEPYMPYWDKSGDKCVFLTSTSSTGKDLSTGEPYAGDKSKCEVLLKSAEYGTPDIKDDVLIYKL